MWVKAAPSLNRRCFIRECVSSAPGQKFHNLESSRCARMYESMREQRLDAIKIENTKQLYKGNRSRKRSYQKVIICTVVTV